MNKIKKTFDVLEVTRQIIHNSSILNISVVLRFMLGGFEVGTK